MARCAGPARGDLVEISRLGRNRSRGPPAKKDFLSEILRFGSSTDEIYFLGRLARPRASPAVYLCRLRETMNTLPPRLKLAVRVSEENYRFGRKDHSNTMLCDSLSELTLGSVRRREMLSRGTGDGFILKWTASLTLACSRVNRCVRVTRTKIGRSVRPVRRTIPASLSWPGGTINRLFVVCWFRFSGEHGSGDATLRPAVVASRGQATGPRGRCQELRESRGGDATLARHVQVSIYAGPSMEETRSIGPAQKPRTMGTSRPDLFRPLRPSSRYRSGSRTRYRLPAKLTRSVSLAATSTINEHDFFCHTLFKRREERCTLKRYQTYF